MKESSTISRLVHCNAYWSTASYKSDKQENNFLCLSNTEEFCYTTDIKALFDNFRLLPIACSCGANVGKEFEI